MLFAAIDIGSNAGRLYFANVYEHEGAVIAEKASLVRIPLRLGEDAFKIGKISEERISNLLKTLKAFKLLIEVYQPLSYIACATAAMREAKNSSEIIERVKMLVSRHEEGGNDDQNLLKDADSVSFFETNISLFLTKHVQDVGKEKVREKFDWMYNRITSEKAKQIARPWYKEAIKNLN